MNSFGLTLGSGHVGSVLPLAIVVPGSTGLITAVGGGDVVGAAEPGGALPSGGVVVGGGVAAVVVDWPGVGMVPDTRRPRQSAPGRYRRVDGRVYGAGGGKDSNPSPKWA